MCTGDREIGRAAWARLRSGVHLGHCWNADEKCAGADVHVGARFAGSARPGEILVSEEAAEQARRAGVAVTDRGVRSLRGLPGTWRVFAASAESQRPVAPLGSSPAATPDARIVCPDPR